LSHSSNVFANSRALPDFIHLFQKVSDELSPTPEATMRKTLLIATALTASAHAFSSVAAQPSSSVLQSLPAEVQKDIEETRARCQQAIDNVPVPSGDVGLVTFTVSGKQAVLVDPKLSFAEHIKVLRGFTRYEPKEIDELIQRQRKGGPEFFSSQIVVQEGLTGSGTFDLRIIHGLSGTKYYRNVTAWDCHAADFPIVYFIGFRVRKIKDGTIFVSREKDIVKVISLKALDPGLDKHIKVQLFEGAKVLCPDIATGCDPSIFYSRE
jgi:hypothetical protein